jgi:hypothetical protein
MTMQSAAWVVCWLFMTWASCGDAFAAPSSRSHTAAVGSSIGAQVSRAIASQFSDVPNDQGNKNNGSSNKNNNNKRNDNHKRENDAQLFFKPPPFPEDWITLSGDLFSLIVYGFADHLIGCDLAQYIVHKADSIPKLMGLMDDMTTSIGGIGGAAGMTVPVWLDVTNDVATRSILQAQVSSHYIVHYASPILQYTGSAVVFMTTFWVLAGWLTRAFDYRNTLQCRSDHALMRLAQSWGLCIVMMLPTLALLSPEPLRNTDILFLVDSLTVLSLWRFMINWMIGSGESSD